MKAEDIQKIAKEAARRINPSMQTSIDQMEGSPHPEIQLGTNAMKRKLARMESVIADAIREAVKPMAERIAELEAALRMLTTWAKTPIDEEGGSNEHLVEVVIENARKVLGLDENLEEPAGEQIEVTKTEAVGKTMVDAPWANTLARPGRHSGYTCDRCDNYDPTCPHCGGPGTPYLI